MDRDIELLQEPVETGVRMLPKPGRWPFAIWRVCGRTVGETNSFLSQLGQRAFNLLKPRRIIFVNGRRNTGVARMSAAGFRIVRQRGVEKSIRQRVFGWSPTCKEIELTLGRDDAPGGLAQFVRRGPAAAGRDCLVALAPRAVETSLALPVPAMLSGTLLLVFSSRILKSVLLANQFRQLDSR